MNAIFAILLQLLLISQEISTDDSSSYRSTTNKPDFNVTYSRRHGSKRNSQAGYRGPRIQIKIGDRVYLRETVVSFDKIPLEMVYDHEGNLFFTKVEINSDTPLSTVIMRNGTNRFRKVPGLRNSQGTAIDKYGTVYFATSDGLYYYDKLENSAKYFALKGEDVFEITTDKKGDKYVVIAGPVYSVHVLKEDLSKSNYTRVPEADSISIDPFNTAYYLRNGFVYMLRNNSTQPRRIKELYNDSLSQIAYDSEDNVYIAYGGGLLYAQAGAENFTRVKKVYGGPTSIAFDRYDNFALGYRKKIYKFNIQKIDPPRNVTSIN